VKPLAAPAKEGDNIASLCDLALSDALTDEPARGGDGSLKSEMVSEQIAETY
jgi:hypothetical protein